MRPCGALFCIHDKDAALELWGAACPALLRLFEVTFGRLLFLVLDQQPPPLHPNKKRAPPPEGDGAQSLRSVVVRGLRGHRTRCVTGSPHDC